MSKKTRRNTPEISSNPPSSGKAAVLRAKGMTPNQIANELGTTVNLVGSVMSGSNPKAAKNVVKSNVQNLPCPICHTLNPIKKINFRLKCPDCGTQLLSIRIKKPRRNGNGRR